jgi:asparagine synthetase B (glutamine-hydrolysing)
MARGRPALPHRTLLRVDSAAGAAVTGERVLLSPIESAVNDAIGELTSPFILPDVPASLHPLEALEEAVLPALERPPCFVLFSGGRDSSLVLAVAARVARREGLPTPVPTTDRFPRYAETDETEWQDLVLNHLTVTEHVLHNYEHEMNFLSPFVRSSIRQHGLVAPAGVHLLVPAFADARGGSVLTGFSGDSLLNGGSFARVRMVAAERARPSLRSLLSLARGLSPQRLRRPVARHRLPPLPSWLRPAAMEELRDLVAAQDASEPLTWDGYVVWWAQRRALRLARQAMERLAATYDVQILDPLAYPRFLAAIAKRGGALGWGTKTRALEALFSDLLPDALLRRETKAIFTRPYWSGDAREFAASWDGRGVPTDLVEIEKLRDAWTRPRPDARSVLLLHAAWSSTLDPDEVREPFNCRLE